MPGIDRIRPNDDGPDRPDAEATRPSWSDRWRAAQAARIEAEENELRQLFADLDDTDDRQTSDTSDPSEGTQRSIDAGAEPGGFPEGHVPDEDRPTTPASSGLDHIRSADPPDERPNITAAGTESHWQDIGTPGRRSDPQEGWQRLSESDEHVPWDQRLARLHNPTGEAAQQRNAESSDTERVQVQRLEQHPSSAAEPRAGDVDPGQTIRQRPYHTTIGSTGTSTETDTPEPRADKDSPRPWWIETTDRSAHRVAEQAPEIARQPRESTMIGSGPPEPEQPNAESDAPMSWVSDRFGVPGGVPLGKGWSGFPVGDSRVGLAADAAPFRDDFGPIDVERWGEVPCVAARPQRTYELRDSDAPLTDDVVAALLEAKENVSEVLEEAAGRELTVEDVEEAMRHINPTGGGDNCVECSKAVDDVLRGHAAVAGPTDDQPPHFVDNVLSIRAIDYVENISPANIERQLLEAGSGAQGIVIGWKNYGPSHAYNVANIEGDVYWLDGQKDIVASDNPHPNYVSYDMYRTA